jgi:hypothetical protein
LSKPLFLQVPLVVWDGIKMSLLFPYEKEIREKKGI